MINNLIPLNRHVKIWHKNVLAFNKPNVRYEVQMFTNYDRKAQSFLSMNEAWDYIFRHADSVYETAKIIVWKDEACESVIELEKFDGAWQRVFSKQYS